MRHKTTKQLYKITMEDGTSITVTEDHSLIVDRDGFLLDVPPTELLDTDLIITLNDNCGEKNIQQTQQGQLKNV